MPLYAKPDIINDIALVRVQMPIQFNDKVQPIQYSTEEVEAGEQLQVTGYGRLSVSTMIMMKIYRIFSSFDPLFNNVTARIQIIYKC